MKNEIQFDHTKETLPDCIGIEMERAKFIAKKSKVAYIEGDSHSESFELAIKAINPQTPAEYWLIGFVMGKS